MKRVYRGSSVKDLNAGRVIPTTLTDPETGRVFEIVEWRCPVSFDKSYSNEPLKIGATLYVSIPEWGE